MKATTWTPLTAVDTHDDRWSNDLYLVRCVPLPLGDALVVRRRDGGPIRDWRHLQAMKNEVLGVERETVEFFPPADRGYPVSANVRVLIAAPEPDPGFVDDGSDDALCSRIVSFPRDIRVLLDPDEQAVFTPDTLPDGFDPVVRVPLNPVVFQQAAEKNRAAAKTLRAWANDLLDGTAMTPPDSQSPMTYLSFKWVDRRPEHHRAAWAAYLAAACGPAAEAVELYPAESRLIDASNQWHLFALLDPPADGGLGSWSPDPEDRSQAVTDLTAVPVDPVTGRIALGRLERDVLTADQMNAALAEMGMAENSKAQQRPWQPGLPTGAGLPGPDPEETADGSD